jgi:hypothetical protein
MYTHTCFVALKQCTNVKNPVFSATGVKGTYVGVSNDDEDILNKVAYMCDAVNDAATAVGTAGYGSDCLKIFVAPEFFFRGSRGSYAVEKIPDIVEALVKHVNKIAFKDWLFVFGSAIGVDESGASKTISNVALVIPGFGGQPRLVMKEYKSWIDFVEASSEPLALKNPDLSHANRAKSKQQGMASLMQVNKEYQLNPDDGGGIFDEYGIRFGVEVCLDHYRSRLRTAISSGSTIAKTAIQIHIVSSCGMSIENKAVVAMKGGYVFLCDGAQPGGTSAACRLKDEGLLVRQTEAVAVKSSTPYTNLLTSAYVNGSATIDVYEQVRIPPRNASGFDSLDFGLASTKFLEGLDKKKK